MNGREQDPPVYLDDGAGKATISKSSVKAYTSKAGQAKINVWKKEERGKKNVLKRENKAYSSFDNSWNDWA